MDGREGSCRTPVAGSAVMTVVVVVMVMFVPPVLSRYYYKTYLDNTGDISLCTPTKVHFPNNTNLLLPMSYCAQVCDSTPYCHAFRLVDQACHVTPLLLTSGYSMTRDEPNAMPYYHLLSMKHYFPNPDLAYRASVTAASNYWASPTFEKDLTAGVLCTRFKCPCTTAKNHSVVVDLGSSLYVKEVHAVTYFPPQAYSQNFVAYVGNEKNKYAFRYTLGQLRPGSTTFVIRPAKQIQFVTFLKSDNLLCLCLVQAFNG